MSSIVRKGYLSTRKTSLQGTTFVVPCREVIRSTSMVPLYCALYKASDPGSWGYEARCRNGFLWMMLDRFAAWCFGDSELFYQLVFCESSLLSPSSCMVSEVASYSKSS